MNKFKGWKEVFSFDYRQTVKNKSYIIITFLICLLTIGAGIAIAIGVTSASEKEDPDDGPEYSIVEYVCVAENKEFENVDFQAVLDSSGQYFEGIEVAYVEADDEIELAKLVNEDHYTMGVMIVKKADGSGYDIRAVLSSNSAVESTDALEIVNLFVGAVNAQIVDNSGVSPEVAYELTKPVVTSIRMDGEEPNPIASIIKYILPAVFGLVLYFMLLFYGQNVSKAVSTEKTSKLVETLLTSVHPYALLTGKIFANVAAAMLQCLIWIAGIMAGLFIGSTLADGMYPDAQMSLSIGIEFLRANIGESALSPVAFVISLLTFACGFLFYSVLSGVTGSFANRPEEAQNTQGLFVFPIVISWILCYIATLTEQDALLTVLRLVPFTVPFC
ncbi:MAG: ABC transporter permease, partial [Lachnospiraceae bacterium]|nr:ABC transporter permease [Lachnospiraceae bacterium]